MIENVDFLLEQEKQDIEQDIVNKYLEPDEQINNIQTNQKEELNTKIELTLEDHKNDQIKKNKEQLIKEASHKTKKELIEKFIQLQETKGEVLITETKLKRLKKDEILKLIADFANEVLQDKQPSISTESIDNKPAINTSQTVQINPDQLNLIAESLFNMNLALVSSLETGSIYLKDKTSNIPLLENWSKRVVERKQNFLLIFKSIYADYKIQLDKYLSPIVQYSIIMTQTAAESIIENVKQKKNNNKKD